MCARLTLSLNWLINHIARHRLKSSVESQSGRHHRCTVCGKVFSNAAVLTSHLQVVHQGHHEGHLCSLVLLSFVLHTFVAFVYMLPLNYQICVITSLQHSDALPSSWQRHCYCLYQWHTVMTVSHSVMTAALLLSLSVTHCNDSVMTAALLLSLSLTLCNDSVMTAALLLSLSVTHCNDTVLTVSWQRHCCCLYQWHTVMTVSWQRHFLAIFPTFPHLLSSGFKSGEFGGHSWSGINSGVSFCNNAMVACAQSALQVSQGSLETLFRRGGAANLFSKRCTKFRQHCPSVIGDITENIVVSFWTQYTYHTLHSTHNLIKCSWNWNQSGSGTKTDVNKVVQLVDVRNLGREQGQIFMEFKRL